ncbi:MAG: hypothetical protein ACRC2S_09545 [Waterburya sp.]
MLVDNLRFERVTSKLKYISLWGLLLSSLTACQPPLISIEQISDSKVGKTVYLTGKVIHLAPLIDNAAYQLEDTTGKIWVITSQSSPQIGQALTIKGKIAYQSLPFAGQDFGDFYIVELEQSDTLINDNQSSVK